MSTSTRVEDAFPPYGFGKRQQLRLSKRQLAIMAFSNLGIIYSDIGTSPLYVLSTIWSTSAPPPSEQDIIGGISAIVWAFTLLPLVKYIGFALSFGSGEGEGGPFALFLQMFPRRHPDDSPDSDRELTKFPDEAIEPVRRGGKLARFRWPLQIWTLFATALTMADGVLTPAVSVTSSVGGLSVVAPVVTSKVIPISIGFLVILFLGQRFGTARLSFLFAPITFVWFCLIGISGVINVVSHPGILRAFDPSRAIMFFVRTKNYDALAGILLALTGCEAVFANLGQFTASSIRISFVTLVYPALIFAYLGQGARLIADGANVISNPFYLTIPGGENSPLWWATWVMGIFATLIASQAMITATFSLTNQLMSMKCFPAIRIDFTSKLTAGQVYIPAVNWLLMIGTVATVAGFGSSFALTLAYGFAVATVMFITSSLIALQIVFEKGYHWTLAILFFGFFGFLDALFWGAALRKVPSGAWFPLALGSALCLFMVFWSWAIETENEFDKTHALNLTRVVHKDLKRSTSSNNLDIELHQSPEVEKEVDVAILNKESYTSRSAAPEGGLGLYIESLAGESIRIQRIPTVAIFHKRTEGRGIPYAFSAFLRLVPALPQLNIFLCVWRVAVAHVEIEERYSVSKVRSLDGFYGVTMRKGYLDRYSPDVEYIMGRIRDIESRNATSELVDWMEGLEAACKVTTHIIPSYRITSAMRGNRLWNWIRKILLEELYDRLRIVFPDEGVSPNASGETLRIEVLAVL